jgi:hypothetical protein
MTITTNVVSSNPDQGEVYNICKWLTKSRWFSPGPPISSTHKTNHHDTTEILLKVALKTIQSKNPFWLWLYDNSANSTLLSRTKLLNVDGEGDVVVDMVDDMFSS